MARVLALLAGTTLAVSFVGLDVAQARDWRLRSIYENYLIEEPNGYFFDDSYDRGDLSDQAIIKKRQASIYQLEDDYYVPKLAPNSVPSSRVKDPLAKKKTGAVALSVKAVSLEPPKPVLAKATPAASAVSCDKATGIVGSYGFKDVKAVGCTGKIFTFNATRGDKKYEIKLSSANGALTEVRKVQ